MNKEYKIKLDLNKKLYNKKMAFNQFDENVNDFYIEVTKNNEVLKDLDKSIITLVAIKPNGEVDAQFIEVKEGQIYADLKPSMCDLVGNYQAKAMIVLEGKIITTDTIIYSVNEDKIISKLNEDTVSDERFPLFTDALARLSTIEISEEQRMINEAERILSEENRKIEEAKRVEAELIRQHEEADRAKYDAIRESNENIRKQNESIRLSNETNRIDEEAKRVEEENKRKLAEEERNANYNFMTEDEERRRSEANSHKEAEVLRVQAETNRVNEEAKRRTTEQARVSAENTRVSNENTREANEITRKSNETKRVEAETQRQNRYNSFITEAEANANNFENYTNNAKAKEEERRANELDRKSQEDRRVSNEVERISNENTRKANEVAREKNETSRQNTFENKVSEVDEKISEINTTKDNFISSINTKVDNKISEIDKSKTDMTTTVSNKIDEVETRFNALTSKQQQDAEVIDARDGETSLKARLDRDIEKAKQVYVNVEGSNISTDSSSGYLKDVEILGNTIQDTSNLADIRSVGDKVEGQELYKIDVVSCGKNLLSCGLEIGSITSNGTLESHTGRIRTKEYIQIKNTSNYVLSGHNCATYWAFYDINYTFISRVSRSAYNITNDLIPNNAHFVKLVFVDKTDTSIKIQLEEGTVATPYEPYQEDKLTILSPVQLEKVGDVADRIIEKDGVWGVEKHIKSYNLTKDLNWVYGRGTTVDGKQYFGYKVTIPNPVRPLSATVMPNLLCNYCKPVSNFAQFSASDGVNTISQYVDSDEVQIMNTSEVFNSVDSFKNWISDKNISIKYPTTQPRFIPLPHDQQVKLRTFANKTNISFGCEIEGTIKAQVPKSLGATVNTHTEQISNLNKELNRVKKLEESTVSTVETESDFTTVEATSNGYFEDVKLEGKTLVNLSKKSQIDISNNATVSGISDIVIKANTPYTYIFSSSISNTETILVYYTDGTYSVLTPFTSGLNVKTIVITDDKKISRIGRSSTITDLILNDLIILEGDHTQNPPNGYIEGLKSVGQSATTSEDGADEIVVESVNSLINQNLKTTIESSRISHKINPIKEDFNIINPYTSILNVVVFEGDNWVKDIQIGVGRHSIELLENEYVEYINQYFENGWTSADADSIKNIGIYTKQDKKRLLYYNNETQSWEKPVLREWDSIEKHSDGKYYYHQRSGEYLFSGNETVFDDGQTLDISRFYIKSVPNSIIISSDNCITDGNFKVTQKNAINIEIKTTELPNGVHSVEGCKAVITGKTVVYQLAEEKVYECTNIDLITYANETNYIVECGAIVPRSTLKVHNNISNVVSLLQKKVSLLESNIKASQEVQDMMILETDMRMLDIELALMEFIPMTLNLGGSNMLRSATYFNFLKNHIINETYGKEYLENVMNKYLATGRINQDEYDELYKMLYPPVYDIELPIEY